MVVEKLADSLPVSLTPSIHSHPALSLPACPTCARCCLVGVAMAPCGQNEASHAASCVLFTEGSWRDWGAVTQNTQYTKAAAWTAAQDSAALSNTHGVTFPCQRSADGQSQTWPRWVTFCLVCLLVPNSLQPESFCFLSCWLLFLNATIFSGTRLGFSLILCTSMDTSGSLVSTRAEEQSFHVRYR